MPVQANAQIIEDILGGRANHLYVDQENLIRDLYIEDMFNTVFHDGDLDEGFRTNFRTYMHSFFGSDDADVPDILFEEVEYTKNYIRTLFGLCHIYGYTPTGDENYMHCTHSATTRTQYSEGGIMVVHAPSSLRAALLTIIVIMRWRADLHFQELVTSEQDMGDEHKAENN